MRGAVCHHDPMSVARAPEPTTGSLPESGPPAAACVAAGVAFAQAINMHLADAEALTLARCIDPTFHPPSPRHPTAPPAAPGSIGLAYEAANAATRRKKRGVHYTPVALARGLVAASNVGCDADESQQTPLVCDPSCGGGAFLLAAADALYRRGGEPGAIVATQLFGIDIDPVALAIARVELALWCAANGDNAVLAPDAHFVVADTLREHPRGWHGWPPDGFTLVLGNPPFASQLRSRTARDPRQHADIAERFGMETLGYADRAALFLLAAIDMVRDNGHVCLVLPQSILAARDAAPIRARVAESCALERVWIGTGDEFDASVHVFAPLLRRRAPKAPPDVVSVNRVVGQRFVASAPVDPWPDGDASWGYLVDDVIAGFSLGDVDPATFTGLPLATIADVTAGFRSHFYGLVDHVTERQAHDTTGAPLITSGVIDPFHNRWATTTVKFAGRALRRPVVDVAAVGRADATLAAWLAQRQRPKVLVAPQGTVVEAIIDQSGILVPSTPVISVAPLGDDPADVLRVAAALSAPIVAAWVRRSAAGTGMSASSVRFSAALLRTIPLPLDHDAWDHGAALVATASEHAARHDAAQWNATLEAFASVMARAYRLAEDHPVNAWWHQRRPTWR